MAALTGMLDDLGILLIFKEPKVALAPSKGQKFNLCHNGCEESRSLPLVGLHKCLWEREERISFSTESVEIYSLQIDLQT